MSVETLTTIRRRIAAKIARMAPKEAEAYVFAHRVYCSGRPDGTFALGGRLGDPGLKAITGGYSSQTLDRWVLDRLAYRAGLRKAL